MITRSSSFISRSSLVFYMISLTLLVIFYLFVPLLASTGSPSSSSFLFCSFSCFVVAVMEDHVCRKRQNRTRSRWGKYEYSEGYSCYGGWFQAGLCSSPGRGTDSNRAVFRAILTRRRGSEAESPAASMASVDDAAAHKFFLLCGYF